MIKSKRWYEGQIKALERAAHNTAYLALPVTEFMRPEIAEESFKANAGVRAASAAIYSQLNILKAEYSLYYR